MTTLFVHEGDEYREATSAEIIDKALVDVRVLDHFIVGDQMFSFNSAGLL